MWVLVLLSDFGATFFCCRGHPGPCSESHGALQHTFFCCRGHPGPFSESHGASQHTFLFVAVSGTALNVKADLFMDCSCPGPKKAIAVTCAFPDNMCISTKCDQVTLNVIGRHEPDLKSTCEIVVPQTRLQFAFQTCFVVKFQV